MEEKKDKKQEQQGFSSNPEKSFEAGKHGGKEAPKVTSQGSHNNAGALGETSSRMDNQNKPVHGNSPQRDLDANSEDTGTRD
jgi:hypothetical protein